MAIGSGLGGNFGAAPETTYGTYVAPTKFPQVNSASVSKVKNFAQGGGLAAGRLVQAGSRRVVVTEAGTVAWEQEVGSKGLGLFLQALMGTTVTPVQQSSTTAYLQTHTLADSFGKSLTVQTGIPDTTGTVRPYTGLGTKITAAEFSCSAPDGLLTVSFEGDCKQVVESQTLSAPSFVTGIFPFSFHDMTVKLGTYSSEAAVVGVKGFSLRVERPHNTERYYAGATVAGTKAEPIANDWVVVSGSFDVDYVTKADFADRFASDASTSCVIDFTSSALAGVGNPFRTTFKVPQVFINEGTPTLEGNDIVSTSYSFVGQYDETNAPVTIEYMSTDVTI